MNIKQEILLLVEEEDLNTPDKLYTAIKNGRVPGISPNDLNKINTKLDYIVKTFKDFSSIYKNAAIKIAVKKILKKNENIVTDAYLAYFNNRNKKEAKTTHKQLFTDFEEGKIKDHDFEKKVNELFKDKVVGKEDANKLYEDDTWLMVIPKTFAASCKYGENTKWCTTSSKSMFDNYSSKSPLMIVINKKTNKKYQLHSETSSFMDEKDEEPKNIINIIESFPGEIQKLLIKNKFNIWNKVLINGVKNNNKNTIKKALDNGADIHAENDLTLRYAAYNGYIEIVKLLLDKGANIHAQDDYVLRYAAANGYTEVVKLLLDKGANIHAQDDEALRYAALCGYTEVVKLLLDNGADIHVENDLALLYAANNGHIEIVKLLLDKGANIHAQDDEALRYAALYGYTEVVKLLLDKGADIHAGNDSALRYAAEKGRTETVKLLKQYLKKENK